MKRARLASVPKKSSYLYFIREVGTEYVKVGISYNPDKRLVDLQTGTPHDLELVVSIGPFQPASDAGKWERWLHKNLKGRHIRGEWYYLSQKEITGILEKIGWMEK